jgi:hypothetical protein
MAQIISFYLPQYHPISENNEWWGAGFTEWKNVVKAKPLFPFHHQPNLPGELGFYDLRLPETRMAQAALAKEYGIDAFCYWHYWFGGDKRLLERPFNEVLSSGKPDFPFCLAWANHSWFKKGWSGNETGKDQLLIEQQYLGKVDYEKHFYEMLPAFQDKRYVKVDEKLFFIIYKPLEPEIASFIALWRQLAAQNGLNDFYFVGRTSANRKKQEILAVGFDAIYNDDVFNIHHELNLLSKILLILGCNLFHLPKVFPYKKAIKQMVSPEKDGAEDTIPAVAPNWDHSPRSKAKGIILHDAQPQYFKSVVKQALDIIKNKQSNNILLIKSWNEWGEGNYLEPDERFGRGNLIALKEAIDEN